MSIIDTINKRNSYRGKYKSNIVPREDLITIMKAGLNAPSGCNMQTTSLIAVDDKDVLNKLHKVINPPAGETAPAIICVLTQRVNAYRDKCFAVQDYSAAIENMLLVIVELGYQSCWYVFCQLVLPKQNQLYQRNELLRNEHGLMRFRISKESFSILFAFNWLRGLENF